MSKIVRCIKDFIENTERKKYNRSLDILKKEFYDRKNKSKDDGKSMAVSEAELPSSFFDRTPLVKKLLEKPSVSIIIPSKDNVDMLFKCFASILSTVNVSQDVTGDVDVCRLEIILVDNGSSCENKTKISEKINDLSAKYKEIAFTYIYEEAEFNFSNMCNTGASKSGGDFLLFLNDDVTAVKGGWLKKMISYAALDKAGAVGVKLLYPDKEAAAKSAAGSGEAEVSSRIQHCGIVNSRIGPMHVFGGKTDLCEYGGGYNKKVVYPIAVTGACLMIRRSTFEDAGGFYSSLAVAFNDVDLCYTLVDKGYRNICLNNIHLIHHESYTRGNDALSMQKSVRLSKELRLLKERHISLMGRDPFAPADIIPDIEEVYFPDELVTSCFNAEKLKCSVPKNASGIMNGAVKDKAVFTGVEYADKQFLWNYDNVNKNNFLSQNGTGDFIIWGYSFVIGADNALYDRYLILRKCDIVDNELVKTEKSDIIFDIHTAYRPDIAKRIEDQKNVELCGFYCKISSEDIEEGIYETGILSVKRYTKQKLYNRGATKLIV